MAGTGARGTQAVKYFLGKCMPTSKRNASKIRIKHIELDENLLMYFNSYRFVFAYDPKKICKTGDTVLVQNLAERKSRLLTHEVIEVIYPMGDVTDPVTGKKVVVGRFREDIKAINQLYGESENAFDYDKEPPRGKTQGKRDFTHKMGKVRWHDDPNKNNPHEI